MGNLKAKLEKFRFKGIIVIAFVFALIAAILLVELSGVRFHYAQKSLNLLPNEKIVTKTTAFNAVQKDALVLYSSNDKASLLAYEQFEVILKDMKIGSNAVDLSVTATPELSDYSLVIILFSDLSHVGEEIVDICRWVYDGGNVYSR